MTYAFVSLHQGNFVLMRVFLLLITSYLLYTAGVLIHFWQRTFLGQFSSYYTDCLFANKVRSLLYIYYLCERIDPSLQFLYVLFKRVKRDVGVKK